MTDDARYDPETAQIVRGRADSGTERPESEQCLRQSLLLLYDLGLMVSHRIARDMCMGRRPRRTEDAVRRLAHSS